MSKPNAQLSYDNNPIDLPVYSGTLGPDVIDVSGLSKQNVFTIDQGFMSTASCQSKITFIDGDQGILLYRGYPIDQLAENCDFLSVSYLLLFGELPNAVEKNRFEKLVNTHSGLPEPAFKLFDGFLPDAHPMAMMLSVVGGLSAYFQDTPLGNPEDQRLASIYQLLAKMPIIAAQCYQHSRSKEWVTSDPTLSYSQNFMHMLFPTQTNMPSLARAMDKIFILHADHEQNASTSAVRIAGSTGANPFACLAAGISALWGPAHGGANEAALNMLLEIGDESKINHFLNRAKDKNDSFRLMGFGHRVYKNYDPRAKVMRATCHEVLDELGVKESPLFKLAMKLEKIALEDDYFVQKKLYPNVDFYSGITLNAMGIPTNMFTVIFALARTIGWLSHWLEMMNDPSSKLVRPRQLYIGPNERAVPGIQ